MGLIRACEENAKLRKTVATKLKKKRGGGGEKKKKKKSAGAVEVAETNYLNMVEPAHPQIGQSLVRSDILRLDSAPLYPEDN